MSIELERILLHSLATSSVNPGIVSITPFCTTGTPIAENSPCAAKADPCCKRRTIWVRINSGNGTKPNKKHNGNRTNRETREPKQNRKIPIHESTRAIISIERRTSEGKEPDDIATRA